MSKSPFSPPEPEPTIRRRSPWLLVIVLVLVPLVLVGIWYLGYRISGSSGIDRVKAKIKERGEPLTLADLAATYSPIPDESNGAVALLDVWQESAPEFWQAFREGKTSLPSRPESRWDENLPYLGSRNQRIPRTGPLPPENLAAAERFLEERKDHLAAVRRALRYPQFRFPVVITNGFSALLPHLSPLRSESRSFRIETLVATERGDADAAIHGMEDAARAGNAMAAEPFLISQLVRVACFDAVLDDMQRLLSRQALSDEQLRRMETLLNEMEMRGPTRISFIAERAVAMKAFQFPAETLKYMQTSGDADSDTGHEVARGIAVGLWKLAGLKDADERLLLETMEEAIALADHEGPDTFQRYERLFADLRTKARGFPPKILSALLLPSLEKAPSRFAAYEGRRRSALTAIAVERYRMAHDGQLPKTLEELSPPPSPGMLKDPFDAGSLRLKVFLPGFMVYSIGRNRVDDGGNEGMRGKSSGNTDETFVIER